MLSLPCLFISYFFNEIHECLFFTFLLVSLLLCLFLLDSGQNSPMLGFSCSSVRVSLSLAEKLKGLTLLYHFLGLVFHFLLIFLYESLWLGSLLFHQLFLLRFFLSVSLKDFRHLGFGLLKRLYRFGLLSEHLPFFLCFTCF